MILQRYQDHLNHRKVKDNMKTYRVVIQKIKEKVIFIEAENREEASEKARKIKDVIGIAYVGEV